MAQNSIRCDREQELLLPPSLREWLLEDHLAWFVLETVAELELCADAGFLQGVDPGVDPQLKIAIPAPTREAENPPLLRGFL